MDEVRVIVEPTQILEVPLLDLVERDDYAKRQPRPDDPNTVFDVMLLHWRKRMTQSVPVPISLVLPLRRAHDDLHRAIAAKEAAEAAMVDYLAEHFPTVAP